MIFKIKFKSKNVSSNLRQWINQKLFSQIVITYILLNNYFVQTVVWHVLSKSRFKMQAMVWLTKNTNAFSTGLR